MLRRTPPAIIREWTEYCAKHGAELDGHTEPLDSPYVIEKATEVGQILALIGNINASLWYDKVEFTSFPKLASFCGLRPGDVAFDIGAHHGIWSLMFERLVGPHGLVVAFEPFPVHAKMAELNFELNASEVQLYRCAIGTQCQRLIVKRGSDSLSTQTPPPPDQIIEIEVCQLHDFMHLAPDVLKIDIEGAEISVLPAVAELLPSIRAIFVEFHPPFFGNFTDQPVEAAIRMMQIIRRNFPHIWIEHANLGWDAAKDPDFIPTQMGSCLYASKQNVNSRFQSAG
jgi:FkbM family methyltransferase